MYDSVSALTRENAGVQEDHVLTMWLPASNEQGSASAIRDSLYRRVLEQLEATPGVKSASFSGSWPPRTWTTTAVEVRARTSAQQRQMAFHPILLSVFAVIGVVLAAIGIYGVMSYTVSQRTREIGIRVAPGAGKGDVVGLVVSKGFRLACLGVVIGACGGLAITRVIRSQLYGITATDPVVFTCVSVFLVFVGVGACYIPARRAAAISPLIARRSE